jgi:dTDP-4-dehydrorhamnose reductase
MREPFDVATPGLRHRPTILLLGANGQVGWELLRSLRPLGQLVATVRSASNHPALHGCRVVDLSDHQGLRKLLSEVQPKLIVNAAAYTAVDKAETETALATAVNGTAPAILAEEARRLGAALVHYSTDYVFNGSGQSPWSEEDPPDPINHYGRSKLAGEEAIRASGAVHLILRTSWVYGSHGHNFVKTMLRLGAERQELKVVDDQVGAPTSAHVVADVTGQILAQGRGDLVGLLARQGGIVHVCCESETSWHGLAEEIFRRARALRFPLSIRRVLPIPSTDYPTPAKRPRNSRLNCTRLRERFALEPPPWQAALGDVLASLSGGHSA